MYQSSTTLYGFSFGHHGRYSSFRRLLHYAEGHRVLDVASPFSHHLNSRIAARAEYRWRQLTEWRLRPIFAKRQRQCVHYLYPENSLFRGWKWKGQHGLVISCHQPAAQLEQWKKEGQTTFFKALEHADRIVLLADNFAAGYEQFCDKSKVRVIPHGIDVHFFRPSKQPVEKPMVITVGNYLRDYDFWADAVLRLAEQRQDVEFAIVALPNFLSEKCRQVAAKLGSRVRILHGLSDEELRSVYHKASALFLPLKDAGANNALLEAMACGVPVLTSDLAATREYAGEAGVFYKPNDVEECVTKLGGLFSDSTRRSFLATAVRNRAVQHLSWEVIAAQYGRIYAEVLEE